MSTFHSLGLSLTALFEKHELLPRRRLEASEAVEKKLAREAVLAALKEEGSDEYPSQDAFEAFRAFIGLVKSDLLSARGRLPDLWPAAVLRLLRPGLRAL